MSEPTPGEIGRQLADLSQRNDADHERIRASLRHKVDRDVYDADMRTWKVRYDQLRADMVQQDRDHQAERQAFQDWRDRRDANRKWWLVAVILPIGGIVVEFISLLRSVH